MPNSPRPSLALSSALLLAALHLLGTPGLAAQGAVTYERRELTIPMRDGISLHTVVLAPTGATLPLPILLVRTPFGAARELPANTVPRIFAELAKDGYIFVVQDIRGRGTSGGNFVSLRPMAGPGGVDEGTDAWDTVDWLVKNLPGQNGKVGILGLSYRGWLAAVAGITPHPALKAISPQAPMVDAWMGDDFFHQGAFRQTQGLLYAAFIEGNGIELTEENEYDLYLRHQTLDSIARVTGVDTLPSWRAFRAHPAYDRYWQERALQKTLTRSKVPTLLVGGFWDDEDLFGAQELSRTLMRSQGATTHLVLGPWSHTTIVRGAGDSLGPVPLGSRTTDHFRAEIERPWFAYHLHGKGNGRFPQAWVYETGADAWRTTGEWPLRNTIPRTLYLRPDGKLSFESPPRTGAACVTYPSDPARPVPSAPTTGAAANWLLDDQRFLAGRSDLRSWRSEPLAEDLVLSGDVAARLFAATSGTDADWVVKLIDEFPDASEAPGYQLMVNAAIFRARYWKGFDRATPVPADSVIGYTIDLHQQQYRFRKGHRLMVQVQSSWFPMYDRNPQSFVPNIFLARGADFREARQSICTGGATPSHLTFPTTPSP